VIEAAAHVLDRDGYAGLTMRGIADELGVQAPALYWYVPSKEALEVQLYDHLMADFAIDLTAGDWRQQVRQSARQLRDYMRRRRDISRIAPQGVAMGTNTLAQVDSGMRLLLAAGLSPRDAAYGFNMLFGYVMTWVEAEAEWIARRATETGKVPAAPPPFDPDALPDLAVTARFFFADDPEGRFEFGLDTMIAGLETRARQTEE
jgi:TetR/AcrR family tetracycline transcriptional repressor